MKNSHMLNVSGADVFSIPGIEMRATTDYPQGGGMDITDVDSQSAKLGRQAASAKRTHGYTQDPQSGMRSAGGPHHPDAGVLEVPRMVPNSAMPKDALRTDHLDALSDEHGTSDEPSIDEADESDRDNTFQETSR